jgi:type IV secretory pathway VirD2 relaxase
MSKHVLYLRREGAGRDGAPAGMFDARGDAADAEAFGARTLGDRHHFRFIVSPEDAAQLRDLRGFTRELMADAERDLGTRLDWIAVDHWNTDNPHVHILVRGRTDDGRDLVISRAYISRGLRDRAAERVTLELGPRSELEIRSALDREVSVERWTSLDRALRQSADDNGGLVDLRPGGAGEDLDLRRLLLGRAAHLERLGLAEREGPACWSLKPGLEETLRALARRGDIIATLHRTLAADGRAADPAAFAIHPETPQTPVLGRLAARGLQDELTGEAYAVIEGVDGRTHHLRFADIEFTGDARPGAIVEVRSWEDDHGRARSALATRSDFPLADQIAAHGATWLDRQLVAVAPALADTGFGAEVREAMTRRTDHLVAEGLAKRHGGTPALVPNLLATLRRRDLEAAGSQLARETGLAHRPTPEGEAVDGVYRQRVTLASGRFAMIDDGLGFQLVPWRPMLDAQLGRQVRGAVNAAGGVDWSFARRRGLGL